MCWPHSGALISCKQPCLPSQEPEGASEASRAGGGWVTSQPKLLFRQSRKEELLFEIFILLSFLNFKHCPKAWAGFVHTTHQKPMCSTSVGPVHRQRRQNIGLRSRGWTEPCPSNTFNDNNLACSRNGELKWSKVLRSSSYLPLGHCSALPNCDFGQVSLGVCSPLTQPGLCCCLLPLIQTLEGLTKRGQEFVLS